jgi:hypothetical protein
VNCPECGAELPSPTHVGLRLRPGNIVSEPIELRPGHKYRRFFYVAYLPERTGAAGEALPPCVVLASEERDTTSERSFIAGSKFYADELDRLRRAWEDAMLAEIAFRAVAYGRPLETLFHSQLRELYHSAQRRADLWDRAGEMLRKMRAVERPVEV